MEVEDRLFILVHKDLTREISSQEKLELEELLSSPNNYTLYNKIKSDWNKSNVPLNFDFDSALAYEKFLKKTSGQTADQNPPQTKQFNIIPLIKYASAIAAVFVLSLFIFNVFSNELIHHDYNDGSLVVLSDGSKVHLAPNSTIDYFNKFNRKREITLNGEAIFEVTKSLKSSFTVNSGSLGVSVLGTTFLVNTRDGEKEVKVLEGKVKVKNDQNELLIEDREGVSVQDNGDFVKLTDVDFSEESDFYKPNLTFKNTPISKVFSDLEAFFEVQIDLKVKKDLSDCTFTSKSLEKLSLKEILLIIETTFTSEIVQLDEKSYAVKRFTCR